VTFKHGGTVLGTSTLSGGVATLAISNFGVGTFTITAVYNGSTDYLTSTSNAVSQTVKKAATSTTVSSSLNPAAAGAKVTFTAKVTPATGPTPTGSVSFKDGTATIAVETLSASGSATFSTTTLAAGTHSITAEYDGSTLNLASTSTVLSQVIK
jgi:autotransporter adhesin